MLMFRRMIETFIGFLTCTIVVTLIMFILWPTIDHQPIIDANQTLVEKHGFGGHLWIILLMLLVINLFVPFNFSIPTPIPMMEEYNLANSFANPALYFLILGIWLVGSFAGGLASRGGLRSGLYASLSSFLFLNLLFSLMTVSIDIEIIGINKFIFFFVIFLFTIVIGSFAAVFMCGLVGGAIGGILGKILFRKEKTPK